MIFRDDPVNELWAMFRQTPRSTSGLMVLRDIRIYANRVIRWEKAAAAIPLLAHKPWACQWQRRHATPHQRSIRSLRRLLREVAKIIGPAPKPWKPRPAHPSDRRIVRQYHDVEATPILEAA